MDDKELDAIQKISEFMETRINETMKDVLMQYDLPVAINILINVATSVMAKAMIMTNPERREHIGEIAIRITQSKVEEGSAAVASLMAINKAMSAKGRAYTCHPLPPKK